MYYRSDILISSVQCGKLTKESKEILGGAGELAQARCVKIINVRAKVCGRCSMWKRYVKSGC